MRYHLLMQRGVTTLGAALVLFGFVAANGCSSVDDFKPTGSPAAVKSGDDGGAIIPADAADGGPVVPPACGAEPVEPAPVGAGSDAGPDGATCPTTNPISAGEIDAQLKWQPPAAPQNVCTQQNIDSLKAAFAAAAGSGGVRFSEIKDVLGASCASCAFSSISAPNWQVFVEDKAGAVDNRSGSCFAQRAGGACGPRYGAVCGRARFRWETCLDLACPESDCNPERVEACRLEAPKGACKGLADAYAAACPDEVDLAARCLSIFDAIATSCSGGPNHTIVTK